MNDGIAPPRFVGGVTYALGEKSRELMKQPDVGFGGVDAEFLGE